MLPLERAVAPLLKSHGFRKKARTWWLDRDEVILLLNLQSSSFGDSVYVNLGVYHKSFGTETSPPEYRCHIRARLATISPAKYHAAIAGATKTYEPPALLMESLETVALPWLESLATREGRAQFLATETGRSCSLVAVLGQ
jgi:Domain of unknown function (DUF4304)